VISAALLLALCAAPAPEAKPAGKHVTLIFTGDDGGEIAPCG
jgi:hypothetical protein